MWSGNADTVFETHKISRFALGEVVRRLEKWYSNLKGDDVMFWVLPGGHLTHALVTSYSQNGFRLATDDELLNIKFTYAMENGPADWWVNMWYTGYSMTCKPSNYKIGYLKEILTKTLVHEAVTATNTTSNENVFLSLLEKDGEEIIYEDVNGGTINVAQRLVRQEGGNVLFELLSASPNTQSLVNIMKYILGQYEYNINYGVTTWPFEVFEREMIGI